MPRMTAPEPHAGIQELGWHLQPIKGGRTLASQLAEQFDVHPQSDHVVEGPA